MNDNTGAADQTATAASPTDLRGKLVALEKLDASELRAEWRRLYRSQPPRLSRDLLIRGVAYRLQELDLAGITKGTQRKLRAFAKELEANGGLTPPLTPQLRPGARLVREWRGRTHTVAVREDGFEYAGKTYPSLTRIAQAITSAHWSGPRFFGLTGNRRSAEPPEEGAEGSGRRTADGLAWSARV